MKKFIALIPFFLGITVYINTLWYGFVYDDSFFVCRPEYTSLSSIPLAFQLPYSACVTDNGIYRPLPTVTIILTQALGKNSAFLLHLENVVFHGTICLLLFVLLRYTLKYSLVISLPTSLLFAVLPIHTEVVANIKSRDELLAAMFFLGMWILYEMGRKWRGWYVFSSICFLCALFSKEIALMFPIIIVSVSYLLRRYKIRQILLSGVWYVPSLGIYWFIRQSMAVSTLFSQSDVSYVFNPLVNSSFSTRIWSVLAILGLYLEKLVFPVILSASYHFAAFMPINNPFDSFRWGLGIAFIIVSLVLFLRTKSLSLRVGIALFFLSYLPVSQLFFLGGDIIGERWMYISSIGICLMLANVGLVLYQKKKKVFVIFFSILIFLYAWRTYTRNSVWTSNETLFRSMISDAPRSIRGYILLANMYLLQNTHEKETQQYLETAYKIYPDDAELNAQLAQIALRQGRRDDAREFLIESTNLDPRLALTDRYWAQLLYVEKDYQSAYEHIKKVINNGVYEWNDMFIYASVLAKFKKYSEASSTLNSISTKYQSAAQVQYLRAVLLYKTGNVDEALSIVWDSKLSREQRQAVFEDF